MTNLDEAKRAIEAMRKRVSRLCAAVEHVNASLDLDTVLSEILESARDLTGARHAFIVTVDESGRTTDFTSSGIDAEQHRLLMEWPDGPQLFKHLREFPEVMRVADLHAYAGSLGCSAEILPAGAFHGTPMRHRGLYVGHFFLSGKEDAGEFTNEDDEVLVLLASQAATAIANARTHRAEKRARAHLEALLDTAPVGVAVFDTGNGHPVSLNREAKRIVESLRTAGGTAAQLCEVMRCRFADGREIALDELPLAQVLSGVEMMRAEEVVLSIPDGRSVTTLVNVTPIHSEDGEVASVVVTLQDLAPLQELERLRAEFLGMVSHELRAPLTSIKGSATTVLEASPVLDPIEMLQFFRIIDEQADHMRGLIGDLLDAGRIDAGTLSVTLEAAEVSSLVDQARNTFSNSGGGHAVAIDLPPELPRVMADRHRIVQVLNNLLSNAARRSPLSSPIRVAAVRDGEHVAISVSDEGKGVPPEQLPHLFQKYTGMERGGHRTAGLGLAICKGLVEAHGGRIYAESGGAGQGTRFTFTVPAAEEAGETAAPDRAHAPRQKREPVPILVVDDDPLTLRFVRDALAAAGYSPLVTGDHRDLSRIIRTEKPHLVLLDLMLPETDGIELMETVPELSDLPVIFISGYGRDETIARALEIGAADYIVKPFSPTELTARIRATLRRRTEPEPFMLEDLTIYYGERRVTVGGHAVQLTATEYDLLRVLSVNAGRVATYDMLIRQVWGGPDSGDPDLVRSFIKKLRHKLGDSATRPSYIHNVRAVGYRMPSPGDA